MHQCTNAPMHERVAVCALAFLCIGAFLHSQSPPPPSPQPTPPTFRTEANYVRVDVLTTIEGELARHWDWGQRNQINSKDPEEDQYRACYPGNRPISCPDGTKDDDRGVADEMIDRRREKQTLNALDDLVRYLRGVREER